MATGTAGTNARQYHQCMVHYLRKAIAYTDGQTASVTVGTVPAGALIHDVSVTVTTAFNNGTTNTLNVGTVASATALASAAALGTVGQVKPSLATNANLYRTTDTVITATHASSGTAATAGQAIVVVAFTTDNDG